MKKKQSRIRLQAEEFDELPLSALRNLEDFELFEDFLIANMSIEVSRGLKFALLPFVLDRVFASGDSGSRTVEREKEYMVILEDLCLKEVLHHDEF